MAYWIGFSLRTELAGVWVVNSLFYLPYLILLTLYSSLYSLTRLMKTLGCEVLISGMRMDGMDMDGYPRSLWFFLLGLISLRFNGKVFEDQ